jgi:hypothetical protein
MKDLIFVLITVGFFALAALYVRACARIVGSDESEVPAGETAEETPEAPPAEVTA